MATLKPEHYWEWRTCIAEMQLAESQAKSSVLQHEMMVRDVEISRLKTAIFKMSLESSKAKVDAAKRAYEEQKAKIEKEYGISLNNKVIDDITFEVKDLE
jgi:hypothetical protein